MSLLWLFVFNLYSASSAKSLNAVWKSKIDSMFIIKIGNNISATRSLIFLYGWDDYIGFFRWVLNIDLHFATQSLCTHASANYVLILFNTIIGTKQIDHDNIYTVQNIKNIWQLKEKAAHIELIDAIKHKIWHIPCTRPEIFIQIINNLKIFGMKTRRIFQ